eukprot:gene18262-21771_t
MRPTFEWTDGFDLHGRDLVKRLCTVDPTKRLGTHPAKGFDEIKEHPFFAGLDWSDVSQQLVKPPALQNLLEIPDDSISLKCSPGMKVELTKEQEALFRSF